jgi:hypothetical protein
MNNHFIIIFIFIISGIRVVAQEQPKIIQNKVSIDANYLPDFSYGGYHNGEQLIPLSEGEIINPPDFGVIPNDGLDDIMGLKKAIDVANNLSGKVV